MKIKEDVLQVLRSSTVDEDTNTLFLPPSQLDRKLYVDVTKCLESIGGKWNKKSKGHVFDHNPSDDLDEMIMTGEWTDKKKEYQFFATPKEIVHRLIKLADIQKGEILGEFSAGDGSILEEFPKENPYVAVELMRENCKKLKAKGFSVFEGDFLSIDGLDVDKAILNVPFSKHQDIKHVLHAWKFVSKRLVSIVSESPFFREDALSRDFRDWLDLNNATVINLEPGDFKSSGTMVKTRIIVVDKK